MVSTTDTQTGSDSGTINGIDVGLTATLPGFATDSFEFDAEITTGSTSQDINVALVIDVSGSTSQSSGSNLDGVPGNETFLEAEKLAAKAVFDQLLAAGYNPDNVTISLIKYSDAARTENVGDFTLNDEAAFDAAVDGLVSGGTTRYDEALSEVLDTWAGTTTDGVADDLLNGDPNTPNPGEVTANDNNLVIFLSDGRPIPTSQVFTDEVAALEAQFGADITAIGIGSNAPLGALNQVDNTGTADQVTDLTQLNTIINSPPPLPELQEVQVVVNGSVLETIPAGDPRLIPTPLGFRIDCEDVTGYPYNVGDTLEVEVRAVFTPNGDTLVVDGFALPQFICFAAGTRILTPAGEIAVEDLTVGDRVVTRDHGVQPIRWVGSTHLPAGALAAKPLLRPVRIGAGALGEDMPVRDLYVSRQHRVLVRGWRAELMFGTDTGVLTPAHTLINDSDIVTAHGNEDGVTYVHIAFDRHEVIYSDGLETESFHPVAETIASLTEPQREELFELFPELEQGEAAFSAARPELRSRDGKALA